MASGNFPDESDLLHPTVRAYVENQRIAEEYDAYFANNPLFRYDTLFLEEYLRPPGRILDLGCGTGRHLVHLEAMGFVCVGLDLNPYMLTEAKANLLATHLTPRLIRADFHRLPLRPEVQFDAMLAMFSTLGLIRTHALRVHVLSSLRPHLAKGGRFFAHFHNRRYRHGGEGPFFSRWIRKHLWKRLSPLEEGDQLMLNYRGILPLVLHLFEGEEIERLFAEAGYRIEELRPLNAMRNGPYEGPDPSREANGFLVCASPL